MVASESPIAVRGRGGIGRVGWHEVAEMAAHVLHCVFVSMRNGLAEFTFVFTLNPVVPIRE